MSRNSLTTATPEVEPDGTPSPLLSKSLTNSGQREPWFLTERSSVIQRAIWMTGFLAIGSCLAGLGVSLTAFLCKLWIGDDPIWDVIPIMGAKGTTGKVKSTSNF